MTQMIAVFPYRYAGELRWRVSAGTAFPSRPAWFLRIAANVLAVRKLPPTHRWWTTRSKRRSVSGSVISQSMDPRSVGRCSGFGPCALAVQFAQCCVLTIVRIVGS